MKEKKLKKVLYISSFLLVVSIIFLPSATSFSWGEIDTQLDYDGIYPVRPRILRGLERSVRPADERPFLLTY